MDHGNIGDALEKMMAPHCFNCGIRTGWGRLCTDCVRAIAISALTTATGLVVTWWFAK